MLFYPDGIEWRDVVPLCRRARYPAEATIVCGDDPAERMIYLVLDGLVRFSILTPDGREQVMVYLPQGSLFGEQAALGRTMLHPNLVAIADEPSEIGCLSAEELSAALKNRPDPFVDLMRITSEKTSLFIQAAARSAFGSARARVASVLEALSRRGDVAITQERLARLCGITRPTASASLRQLEEEGIIGVRRNSIHVYSVDRLTEAQLE